MRRRIALALVPFLLAGCLSPLTRRLDEANERAAASEQQLIIATAKLDEGRRILQRAEKKLDVGNASLRNTAQRLEDIDTRLAVIEQGMRRLFGIKGP